VFVFLAVLWSSFSTS